METIKIKTERRSLTRREYTFFSVLPLPRTKPRKEFQKVGHPFEDRKPEEKKGNKVESK